MRHHLRGAASAANPLTARRCSKISPPPDARADRRLYKAKDLRPIVERLITLGKHGRLAGRRRAIAALQVRLARN
jgi:hypothetical protein